MKHRVKYLALVVLATLAVVLFWQPWQTAGTDNNMAPSPAGVNKTNQPKLSRNYPFIGLQSTVNTWAARQSGSVSVVVYDLANHKTAASLNPGRQYFTASIYKLYVAYIGYQKIADGTYQINEPYISGYTRGECLDAMIRDSYSPCGERMWNELGKENLTDKLKTYGLADTSMTALQTSAKDSAIILQRLYEKKDLTNRHQDLFLASLKTQPAQYRRGLPSGFSESTVYTKVGWNGLVDWHDTAIITLPNKRSYVITVFTQNIGSAQIRALGQAIEARRLR